MLSYSKKYKFNYVQDLTIWCIFLVFALSLSLVSALVPLVILAIYASISFLRYYGRGIYKAHFFYAALLSTYLTIGGVNISAYRGTITNLTMQTHLLCLLSFLTAILIFDRDLRGPTKLKMEKPTPRFVILATLVPGILAFILMMAWYGFIPFSASKRFTTNPLVLLMLESLLVPIILLSRNNFLLQRSGFKYWSGPAILLLLLMLSGYRGWIVLGIFMVGTFGLLTRQSNFSIRKLAFVGLAVVVLIVGGDALRRLAGGDLLSTSRALSAYRFNSEMLEFLAPIHFAFRETISIAQYLWTAAVPDPSTSYVFADFATLLPGKQLSGGQLIGNIVGRFQQGGLTPGLIGDLVFEYGGYAYPIFAILGALTGRLASVARRQPYGVNGAVYAMYSVYILHWFHRGILKPAYIFVTAEMFLVFVLPPILLAMTGKKRLR